MPNSDHATSSQRAGGLPCTWVIKSSSVAAVGWPPVQACEPCHQPLSTPTWKPPIPEYPLQGPDPSAAFLGTRKAFWPENRHWADTPTYQFEQLQAGNVIDGPAIVEAELTTIVVPPRQRLTIDKHGLGVLEAIDPAPHSRRIASADFATTA